MVMLLALVLLHFFKKLVDPFCGFRICLGIDHGIGIKPLLHMQILRKYCKGLLQFLITQEHFSSIIYGIVRQRVIKPVRSNKAKAAGGNGIIALPIDDTAGAIGILTITPSEAAIIAADVATKAAAVSVAFVDRFSGSVVVVGDVQSVESALTAVLDVLENTLHFAPAPITKT